jgi:UDP-N-acetylmuramyl pentapeptide phosphotransferase/UDP-N-acetylglucosamine-1-phosphate transferase
VPRGGGLAIVAICLAAWCFLPRFHVDQGWLRWAGYGVGAAMIVAVSWLDDLRSSSTAVRLAVHGLAALLLMLSYGVWDTVALPLVGNVPLGWLAAPLVFVWIVGLTNAYNFMEGIDGIAAVQAIVAGAGWMILGGASGQ